MLGGRLVLVAGGGRQRSVREWARRQGSGRRPVRTQGFPELGLMSAVQASEIDYLRPEPISTSMLISRGSLGAG
jgi:hypothetical protein